ncbi:GDYXXLXY domain-containing protein [Nocardioides sp. KIGAM211]|uniref:GDYXXLXY domain-containing protein n=1 Tax=Nocardioides luti TaxID=2761101 RepID=A0A7X0RI81_9ACTN|nr:GDYXXLXY domain-containing protein [Nocardioides luti]MBB6628637.1 GDYXXLXY domain-containing protein [Nocardioides luti]
MSTVPTTVAVVAAVQLALVGVAVAPRLSAYTTGEEYRVAVAAVDPVDPFRGAYVDLAYPGVQPARHPRREGWQPPAPGTVYLPLRQEGAVWVADGYERSRPGHPPYLTCESDGWDVDCGIGSWFADQDEAARLGERLSAHGGTATVRVDGRGHAVLVAVEPG